MTDRPPRTAYQRLLQLDRPVGVFEEGAPRLVLAVRELQVEQGTAFWLLGLANQSHVRFLRSSTTLAHIAADARADDVVPRALTALAARDDVVEAQFRGRKLPAAVLTLVVVAREDVAAVELHRL